MGKKQTNIDYDALVHDALRGVVRAALHQVSQQGLPGGHHFYITFGTQAPGVDMSDCLRTAHPTEMTIALEHQFWNLRVEDSAFKVTLSFGGTRQDVCIPFAAVTAFQDPWAKFGLTFISTTPDISTVGTSPPSARALKASVPDKSKKNSQLEDAILEDIKEARAHARQKHRTDNRSHDGRNGKVVSLDAFRSPEKTN